MLPHVLDEDVHSNERKLFGEKITNEEIDIEINHAQRYDLYRIDSVYCLFFGTGTGE